MKSLRGASADSLDVAVTGFSFDRHWMLVDSAGKFLTQRQLPSMVLIRAAVLDGQLKLTAPGMDEHLVSLASESSHSLTVRVWSDQCRAVAPDPAADRWLADFLGCDCRLVLLPGDSIRRVDAAYADTRDRVGFADGFPFLLISQASLDDLNRRMAEPLSMERFRPNLVVSGCVPYAEDNWRRIAIGGIEFRVVKPCSRCIIPTIDPETGARSGQEPLATLSAYRMQEKRVYFGQNLIHDGTGRLATGMEVEVLEEVSG